MKTAIVLVLCLAALASADEDRHNFEWGKVNPGDNLLYREIVTVPYKLMRVVDKDVKYNGLQTISYIKATDQYTNGDGGYAMLENGGPGYQTVTIHCKSQRNHGFNFIVEIYGR